MVMQTFGSNKDYRTNSSERLNNSYSPRAESNQDHFKIKSQSYVKNRFGQYSSDNNLFNIYHQNIVAIIFYTKNPMLGFCCNKSAENA
jgi:hypothetical protein